MSAKHRLFTGGRASAPLLLKPFACLVAILTASIALSIPLSAAVTFTASEVASGDSSTLGIVAGDFNNDGILDLVTTNAFTLSYYQGLGGGQYAAPVNMSLPFYQTQVVAADLNGDGKLDLITVGGINAGMRVLLGNGDGTFTLDDHTGINTGGYSPVFVFLADFNGDHIPDIAFSVCDYEDTCETQVFLGTGDGTFKQSATLTYGGGAIVAGDFNGDGHQDIAVLTNTQVVVYLGEGNGQFQSPLILIPNGQPTYLTVGDFYDDRIQSLAVLNGVYESSTQSFTYYVNTVQYVDGQLVGTTPQRVSKLSTGGIAAGDLTGNFKDDLVVTGGGEAGFTGYMLGRGNGTFDGLTSAPAYADFETSPFVRDLNLDSRHDIGAVWDISGENTSGGAFVLLNDSAKPNCDPPPANNLGVNICAPTDGEIVDPTYTFRASGNAFDGIAKRMELWIDCQKVGQDLEDQLKITTTVTKGSHTAAFVAVDSFDNYTTSTINFAAR